MRQSSSGYGYEYRKTLRLVKGKSDMELAHDLKNIGNYEIETQVYNHNFRVIDGKRAASGNDGYAAIRGQHGALAESGPCGD